MIKSYLLAAIRSLWKEKATSFIKILGLAIGLSVVLLIFLFVRYEQTYDSYHKNGDYIYRVAYTINNKYSEPKAKTGDGLSSLLQNTFPEIELAARLAYLGDVVICHNKEFYKEEKFLFADPELLQMFSYPFIKGNKSTSFAENKSVLISSRIAKKYFGDDDPVGKYLDDNLQLKVTGVVDVPQNSHFTFDFLASYSTVTDIFPVYKKMKDKLLGTNVYTYIMLSKTADAQALKEKLPDFAEAHISMGDDFSVQLFIEPLKEINFNSASEAFLGDFKFSKFTKPLVYFFIVLGAIVLVIACVNFINIAIAHVAKRTKEVCVRKVYGAKGTQIFWQFVFEYSIYSLLAIIISILIIQFLLPLLNSLIGAQISINYGEYFFAASSILLVIVVLTASYPSLLVANVNPVSVFKLGFKGPKSSKLRSFLVVSQFTISIILILTSLYLSRQITFLTEMDHGIKTKDVLVIRINDQKVVDNYSIFKSEIKKNPYVMSVNAASNIPVVGLTAGNIQVQVDGEEPVLLGHISVDPGFTENMGIESLEGTTFSEESSADNKSSFVLGKTAVKRLQLNQPVGKDITLMKEENGNLVPDKIGRIIGVVDDYDYKAPYERNLGVILEIVPKKYQAILVRLHPGSNQDAISSIASSWNKFFGNTHLSASFLDNEIQNEPLLLKFKSIQRFINVASWLSFIIALLGLFGLSLFNAQQQIKEIGIHRINGATILNLLLLSNKKLISLILISVSISLPIVYFLIETVKLSSTKIINLSLFSYAGAMFGILTIAMLTVSWQSWRAATRNPVEALRYE